MVVVGSGDSCGGKGDSEGRQKGTKGRKTDDGLAVLPPRYPLPDTRYWFGIIARWPGEGTVFPFSIGCLECARLEKPGTVTAAFVVE